MSNFDREWLSDKIRLIQLGQVPNVDRAVVTSSILHGWNAVRLLKDEFHTLEQVAIIAAAPVFQGQKNTDTLLSEIRSGSYLLQMTQAPSRRRPPEYPLPKGLSWRHAAAGLAAGDPLSEWAYVTPKYLDGITSGELAFAAAADQADVATFWFLSNYEPFVDDGRNFTFGVSRLGEDHFAQDTWTSAEILSDEFAGVLPSEVLSATAEQLSSGAKRWRLIESSSQILLEVARNSLTQDQVLEAIARLEAAVQALTTDHRRIGHNQGPPILATQEQAVALQATNQARDGVIDGADGKTAVNDATSKLVSILKTVAEELLKGLANKAGQDIYSPAKHLAIWLFHTLNEAISALVQWISLI